MKMEKYIFKYLLKINIYYTNIIIINNKQKFIFYQIQFESI